VSSACACHDEVARLHRFFQDWFQGVIAEDEFALCDEALAPGFTIVPPSGDLIPRADILEGVRHHRGREPDDFHIETAVRNCQQIGEVHIVTYEEHQVGTRPTIRLSTAVLTEHEGGFRWHAVHETWVPE